MTKWIKYVDKCLRGTKKYLHEYWLYAEEVSLILLEKRHACMCWVTTGIKHVRESTNGIMLHLNSDWCNATILTIFSYSVEYSGTQTECATGP